MTDDEQAKLCYARAIKDRLTKTLVHLRLAKVGQFLGQTGHDVEKIIYIEQKERGWRIGPVRPFSLHSNEVAALTFWIRALHYRMRDTGPEHDDASAHRLSHEIAEYFDTNGYIRARLQQRFDCLKQRWLNTHHHPTVATTFT